MKKELFIEFLKEMCGVSLIGELSSIANNISRRLTVEKALDLTNEEMEDVLNTKDLKIKAIKLYLYTQSEELDENVKNNIETLYILYNVFCFFVKQTI